MLMRPSAMSLLLHLTTSGGDDLGSATGFLVEFANKTYLITNRHVVRAEGSIERPKALTVFHLLESLNEWEAREEPLYDADGPLWLEHPNCDDIDIAALPLTNVFGVNRWTYDAWNEGPGLAVGISDPLHIIGFPFGVTGGGMTAIWVRGFIASEPSQNWNNLPCLLIDSRTRSGQSGSPVIAFSSGGPTPMADGGLAFASDPMWQLMGVYSGRINRESDLGIVWKPEALREVIKGQRRAIVDWM